MATKDKKENITVLIGEMISFRNSLKLVHWAVTGKGSYETHLSLDQAIDALVDITDRLVETTIADTGTLEIVIPETKRSKDFIKHISDFYDHIEKKRDVFEETFSQSIIDDFQETIKQLLYRLKRLE